MTFFHFVLKKSLFYVPSSTAYNSKNKQFFLNSISYGFFFSFHFFQVELREKWENKMITKVCLFLHEWNY